MKKIGLKFTGVWNEVGIEIVGFRVIGNIKSQFQFEEYKPGADIVQITNKRLITMTYQEYFKKGLNEGKGLIYQDYFIFAKETIGTSKEYEKFINEYESIKHQYKNYLDGALYDSLYDLYNFGFIKSLILRTEIGSMSIETLRKKISQYCVEGTIENIISKIKKSA